jgi:hypothetical protein
MRTVMLRYPLEMLGGNLVVHYDNLDLLLDTGSPVSMGRQPSCYVLGREIPLLQRYKGMTVEQRSGQLGTNIDLVLGTDVLAHHAVGIDLQSGEVDFDDDPPGLNSRVAPLATLGGIPVVEVRLGGRTLRALFHTGAALSCLPDAETRTYRCVGVARDSYPGFGEFATELRRVPLMFGDQPVGLECGLLPSAVEAALRPLEVHGVVGTNLLQLFSVGWGPGFSELRLQPRRLSGGHRLRVNRYEEAGQLRSAS